MCASRLERYVSERLYRQNDAIHIDPSLFPALEFASLVENSLTSCIKEKRPKFHFTNGVLFTPLFGIDNI